MTFEEGFRAVIREELRAVVREELSGLIDQKASSLAEEFLTIRQAAELAHASPSGIRKWIAEGRLREHRAGTKVLIRRADMLAFMQSEALVGDAPAIDEQVSSILGRHRR